MNVREEFPADRVPAKPDAEISGDRVAYTHEMELGKTATGRVWEPSELDIAHFNRNMPRQGE